MIQGLLQQSGVRSGGHRGPCPRAALRPRPLCGKPARGARRTAQTGSPPVYSRASPKPRSRWAVWLVRVDANQPKMGLGLGAKLSFSISWLSGAGAVRPAATAHGPGACDCRQTYSGACGDSGGCEFGASWLSRPRMVSSFPFTATESVAAASPNLGMLP